MLPEITAFAEALTIASAMNQLQSELIMLHAPLSDIELIITHTNKLSFSPEFLQLKLEYLQRASFDRAFVVQPPPPASTWADYYFSVHRIARASNSTNRTATMLQAFSPSLPSDDQHAFATGRAFTSFPKHNSRPNNDNRTASAKPSGFRHQFGSKRTGPINPGAKRDRNFRHKSGPVPERLSPTQ